MRLLVVGSDLPGSLESYYMNYLPQLVDAVQLIDIHGEFMRFYHSSLGNKISYRLGVSRILTSLNQLLVNKIITFMPTHVWVFKGMEIFPDTIKHIKGKKIKIANYNPDNPFIFSGKGSGNVNVTNSLELFHLHFTYNTQTLHLLLDRKLKASFLPFGFESDEIMYQSCQKTKEIKRVCFVGNPDSDRSRFIIQLAEAGIHLDIYGSGWKLKHPNISCFPSVYREEFWKTLYKYRVQLNLLRKHNIDSHCMRSFEVPGIGGISLSPNTSEHRLFFDDQKNIFLYNSLKDCVTTINHLLSLSEDQANFIRQNARNKSIHSGYSYQKRAEFVVSELSSL